MIQNLLDFADLILYTAQITLLTFSENLVTSQSFGVWSNNLDNDEVEEPTKTRFKSFSQL